MKRFQFQLESALTWRRQKERTLKARLEELAGQKERLRQQSHGVAAGVAGAEADTLSRQSIAAEELAALDEYRRASERRQRGIDSELAKLEEEVGRQRAELVEATRQTKLLEKLKERRYAAWEREAGAIVEQEAQELYLAQWLQQRD